MRVATVLTRAGSTVAVFALAAGAAAASDVVISQFYPSGGLTGASYKNDFVELFNRGASPVGITGYSLQFKSPFIPEWGKLADLSGTVAPGGYYLIQCGSSSPGAGQNLPAPDFVITGNLPTGGGSLVLSTMTSQFFCQTSGFAADRIGMGDMSQCPEGTDMPGLGLDQAAIRADAGCTDTDNNLADFAIGPPTPRNSASPAFICGVTGIGALDPVPARLGVPSPNPSSGETQFAYTVSRDGLVRLDVFDLKGRRVRTLVSGWRPAGEGRASWDGARDDGAPASAGVYFARFTDSAPGAVESRRFVRSR